LSEITLSKAVRSNLLNLQSTAELMSKTQERLATGLKVNSALDNPTNYFTASSLKARSSDLGNLLDSVSNAIQTVEAADNGITAITKLVQSAQSTARQALQDRSHSTVTNSAPDTSVALETTKTGAEAKTLDTDLGLTAGDTITFTSTNATTNVAKTFTYTVGAGDTVQDLVTAINVSGAASAAVASDGSLDLSTDGTKSLTVDVAAADPDGGVAGNHATTFLSNLGYTTGVTGVDFVTNATAGTDTGTLTVAAAGTTASTVRADLATQFNDLLTQIDKLAEDSGYNGVNLLGGSNETLKLTFNEDGSSNIQIKGIDASSTGLGISAVSGDFTDDDDIQTTLGQLSDALSSLRSQSSRFGSNLSVIQTRQDFTKSMINTLETGAANLTLADTNEEAANLLALQTRQQLSSTALSLASQADQQVLRLF
jgi:flagellin-like hook-associated protein FlgL